MDFQIHVNLPYSHLGLLFLFFYLLMYTNASKYIKKGAITYYHYAQNRINFIANGQDSSKENVEEIKDVDEKKNMDEKKEEVKEPIKFEDKYLSAFKLFSNDYFFTEEELLLKAEKYTEFKEEYLSKKEEEHTNMHNLLIETLQILNMGTTITEEMKEALVKYFEIEDTYNDDPSSIDFDELYIYVENDSQKFLLEVEALEKNTWTPELEAEIQEKALQHVLNLKLDGFINNYILECTPLGNVYMRYNNQKKSFEYYSNSTIPYRFLESVGRKYVMTFRCKALFVDLEEELKIASEKEKEKEKEKVLENEKETKEKDKGNAVQKFKSYNKELKMDKTMMKGRPGQNAMPLQMKAVLPITNTNGEKQVLKENANRYTWIDRLTNLPLLKKVNRKTIDKQYALSFADFKKMQEIKK